MQFTQIAILAGGVDFTFQPFDRGTNGAYVWRQTGVTVHAPLVVASASINDTSSDKLSVQLTQPRVADVIDDGLPPVSLGSDLVKTELRFLATTSKLDRVAQVDKHIALLQELRGVIEDREVIYS